MRDASPPIRERLADGPPSGEGLRVAVEPAPLGAERLLAAAEADRAAGATVLRLFRPTAAVAIGRDQAIAREVRLSHCRAEAIPVLRRPTGGGALWLDPGQIGLALVVDAARLGIDPAARLARGAAWVADGLARLGLATTFHAPNDLQVDGGAKIASLFLADREDDGPVLLLATVLVDFDVRAALTALLVPTEKLTVTGLEHARERIATLRDRLAPCPDAATIEAALIGAIADGLALPLGAPAPLAAARAAPEAAAPFRADPDADPWATPPARGFETEDRTARATLRLRLDLAEDGETVTSAHFATDAAHLAPDISERFAAALVGATIADLPNRARRLTAEPLGAPVGLRPDDLVRLTIRVWQKHRLARVAGLDPAQTSGLMVAGAGEDAAAALAEATVMLVPYCAKPAWCALRPTPDCIDCGHCEVGDAYRLARERGLDVTTITNFEHLSETLAAMRARGVRSYVGMCCSDFFLKRHAAFRDAGMDAVLMDIVGATCYELKEEHLAYAGAFKAEASLDLDALEKVVALVPPTAERRRETAAPPGAAEPGEAAAPAAAPPSRA